MRIGIVCYPTFGGSGVVATELGLALSKIGHEIHFITYNQPVRLEQLSKNVFYHEVNVPEYPLFHYQPYELALSSKLVNVIKCRKLDVLHVHYAIPHAYAGYMAKKMLKEQGITIPMVTTLHGTDITLVGNHPFYKPAVNFSINKSEVVTSVSKSLRDDTLRLFDTDKTISVVPNFIDFEKQKDSFGGCNRQLIAEDDERILTHISNFREVKRIPDVINVFYKVQKKLKSKLIMVGEGPEVQPAKELTEKLGIEDKVLFLGKTNEVNKILCFSDLFLLPSESESFGLAALEAMSNGVPVVASKVGGISEVVKNGTAGYLADLGDVDAMADWALDILEFDDRLKQFKRAAKEVALGFDIDRVVPQYVRIYERALKTDSN